MLKEELEFNLNDNKKCVILMGIGTEFGPERLPQGQDTFFNLKDKMLSLKNVVVQSP